MKEFAEVNEQLYLKWNKHLVDLEKSGIVPALENNNHPRSKRALKAVQGCSSKTRLKHYPRKVGPDLASIDRTEYCKNNIVCPFCPTRRQWIKSKQFAGKFHELIKYDKLLNVSFITLSPKNYRTASDGLKTVNKLRSIVHRKCNKSATEFNKIVGGVTAVDVAYSKDKTNKWNIHLHIVALHHGELDQSEMVKTWKLITKDGSYHVDIKPVDKTKTVENKKLNKYTIIGRCEYITKPHKLFANQLVRLNMVCKNYNFTSSFGFLRGMDTEYYSNKPKDLNEGSCYDITYDATDGYYR